MQKLKKKMIFNIYEDFLSSTILLKDPGNLLAQYDTNNETVLFRLD